MKRIVAVFSLVILFSLCMIKPIKIFSAGGDFGGGGNTKEKEGLRKKYSLKKFEISYSVVL